MALVEMTGVVKAFPAADGGRLTIIDGLDFTVRAGETVAIVGASGIGKSTLLHIIGTLDRPDEGSLTISGEDVFKYDDARLARFRNEAVGFVFQFHHLLPEFSAIENVMMPALIKGNGRAGARREAGELLSAMGMAHRLEHRVPDLSGGEQQRVALARALMLKPLLLLADEPTGNLDKDNSEQVHRLLYDLNQQKGMTLIVVTHNLELAAYMSRRVTLTHGKLTELE